MERSANREKRQTGHAMTYEEIAQVLGISRGRVFQIEQRALAKLREAFRREGVTCYRDPDSWQASDDAQRYGQPGPRAKA